LIAGNCADTAVCFLDGRFGTDGIAEPVGADGKTDPIAFGGVSAELFIYRAEAVAGSQHGELIPRRFYLFPVHFTLKFTDINSFYIHIKESFQKIRYLRMLLKDNSDTDRVYSSSICEIELTVRKTVQK